MVTTYRNQFRIIAGHWRRRRLNFPAGYTVRPTPDRVRETLFNWLTPMVAGAQCLDLFAGSGALGLEALSRGAARVSFIEREPRLAAAIQTHLADLEAAGGRVVTADALAWLATPENPADIVFADPPFDSNLLEAVCERLERNGWLTAHALIYLEHSVDTMCRVPENWLIKRATRAGRVAFELAVRCHARVAVT